MDNRIVDVELSIVRVVILNKRCLDIETTPTRISLHRMLTFHMISVSPFYNSCWHWRISSHITIRIIGHATPLLLLHIGAILVVVHTLILLESLSHVGSIILRELIIGILAIVVIIIIVSIVLVIPVTIPSAVVPLILVVLVVAIAIRIPMTILLRDVSLRLLLMVKAIRELTITFKLAVILVLLIHGAIIELL